ncbi:hypothetical protein VTO42DRAFT_3743 [Malbranchea cinnamomea]
MDHEKPPHALVPQYHEFPAEANPLTGESHHVEEMMVEEPLAVDDRKDPRRGDTVWRVLRERHINMIAFSGTIGNGLFLGSGRSLAGAGPGGAVVAYILMGIVIASVMSSLGEMVALMPVNAPAMEFPRRFLDRGVGFAVGWVYWFAYCVLAADQLVAATNAVRFLYDDGETHLSWVVGRNVNPAVWVTLFLVLVTIVNMLPVIIFGELEYVFGSLKLTFITLLIVMMLILSTMQPRANAYYREPLGTKYWDSPYSFFAPVYNVKGRDGEIQRQIEGSVGTLLGVWTTMINVIFSYVGMDIFAATAAESKALPDSESMKMAARKISIRAVTLYAFAMLTVSFAVPRDHRFLNNEWQSAGASSPFVIAVVEAGLPTVAHFFNAVFLFSAFTCAINSMYVASRVLHTLALRDQTGPEFITKRLRRCHAGVPLRAVLATALMMLLGYLGPEGSSGESLSELATNCTVSCLIVYATICATYLCFYRTLEETKNYGTTSEMQAACYDRDHPRYPYKSHGQWLKAAFGLVACVILILFNGVAAFVTEPFNTRHFFASYIGIPVYFLLIIGYKVRRHGFRISQWGPERSNDLSNTVQVTSETRKGRLEFPEQGMTMGNLLELLRWIWVWVK